MAAPPTKPSWKSAVAEFVEYCRRPMPDSKTTSDAIIAHLAKTESDLLAHIKPGVFLRDPSSTLPLKEQLANIKAMKPLSDPIKREESGEDVTIEGPMKLSDNDDEMIIDDTEVKELQDEYVNMDDAVSEVSDEDDDMDDAVTEVSDEDDESPEKGRLLPETHIAVEGCAAAIPIWEYLGEEWTQDIVELLEAPPIEQPGSCLTELKDWQLAGVGKLLHLFQNRHKGGILGDEQGLGKTVTAITAMVEDIVANEGEPHFGFNLIVTTKSCAPQWIDEIKKHYGSEMAKKAFFLNDPNVTANELLDGKYYFVVCTWQFVMSRYAAFEKNINYFKLVALKGSEWVEKNVSTVDQLPLNVRHISALFSHVYKELGLPIRHLVLDEAQIAKNVSTKTYKAVRHLYYDRIMLLSGTFLANRWYDIFGFVSLIPGHPFDDFQQFMRTFARKEQSGYYSSPSVSKRNRLLKFLMIFTISRPVSVLNLPPLSREYHDFKLTDDEEAEVAARVKKFLRLMSMSSKEQVFHRSSSSRQQGQKALIQAVLAQLQCANRALLPIPKPSVGLHLLSQNVKLKDRFAAARNAAGGKVTMEELLGVITPRGMDPKQAVSSEVAELTEERFNTSLEQQQGETVEVEGDVSEDVVRNNQARIGELPLPAEGSKSPVIAREEADDHDQVDYKSFKSPEAREAWLKRLCEMSDDELLSSKVVCILNLLLNISSQCPGERIIVFSRYLKFLDVLGEAIRRDKSLSGMVPLQFNGTLSSEQRSFSQKTFNNPTNDRPIFITAGSGGAGLNLTGGSQIIQCEPWWNHNDEAQAQSRAWRLGQSRKVQVYVIRGTNSLIDHVMEQCQVGKTTINTAIMGPLRRKDDEEVIIPRQYQGGVGED